MAENQEIKLNEEELVKKSIEARLVALYTLQQIDKKVDDIRRERGELPKEVRSLEDEVAGLETRVENFNEELKKYNTEITNLKIKIKEVSAKIKKYQEQQENVRNNREYDSLTKEIEYESVEVQICEKRIREYKAKIEGIEKNLGETQARIEERKADLDKKRSELDGLVQETQDKEEKLLAQSAESEAVIDERYLVGYKRIRKNVRNGLAVVTINRDACGGCHNKIPAQHQLDIRMHKKVIVCEFCGRFLVDDDIVKAYENRNSTKEETQKSAE